MKIDQKVDDYAKKNGLLYKTLLSSNLQSTTFRPFVVSSFKTKTGEMRIIEKTEVFIEKLDPDTTIDESPKTLVFKLDIDTYENLVDLNHWNYNWIVKFALLPKLIINSETKELKLILKCLQICFESKRIKEAAKSRIQKALKSKYGKILILSDTDTDVDTDTIFS